MDSVYMTDSNCSRISILHPCKFIGIYSVIGFISVRVFNAFS